VQAEIEVQVLRMGGVAARAEDGEEIAAGGDPDPGGEPDRGEEGGYGGRGPIGRAHGDAAAVAQGKREDVEGVALGVLAELASHLTVALAADVAGPVSTAARSDPR
jgi:hypothetical protein